MLARISAVAAPATPKCLLAARVCERQVLYLPGKLLACRSCSGLACASQQKDRSIRKMARAWRSRRNLAAVLPVRSHLAETAPHVAPDL